MDEKSSTDDDILEIDQDVVFENTRIHELKGQEVYSELSGKESYPKVVVGQGNQLYTDEIVKMTSNVASNVQVSERNMDNLTQKLFSDDEDGEIGLRPEVTYESDVDITACQTQKIPADDEADIVLEVESNEQLIEGGSFTSQTCETQKIPEKEEGDVLEIESNEQFIEVNSITLQTCEIRKIPADEESDVVEVESNEQLIEGSIALQTHETQKIPADEEGDVVEVESNEQLIKDNSFASQTYEFQEILSDDDTTVTVSEVPLQSSQFVANTVGHEHEKLRKNSYSEGEEHSMNEIIDEVVAQEVAVMMLEDRQDAGSTVSETHYTTATNKFLHKILCCILKLQEVRPQELYQWMVW